MRLRQATVEDAAAISELIRPLAEKYIACEFSATGAENLLKGMTAEAIRGFFEAGFRYHVAEGEGGLIGVVATRDDRHLYHLFVAESHQRRGVARSLWELARGACAQAGSEGPFTVNSSRFAVGVYERLGFRATSGAMEMNEVVFVPMVWRGSGFSHEGAKGHGDTK